MTAPAARSPFAALAWLLVRGVVNRTVRRLRRARQPRYAVALIAGLAYLWFIVGPRRQAVFTGVVPDGTAHLAYALGCALLVASWWLFGSDEVALNFSTAEVQMLFPAPVTRRQLVAFKLLQSQLLIVVNVLFWTALLGRAPGSLIERPVSLWIVFTTLYLHRVGSSLVRESAAEHGAAGLRRHLATFIVVAAALVALVWGIAAQLPALRAAIASGNTLGAAVAVLHSPTSKVVLYPFRLMLAPVFTPSATDWFGAVWPALLIVALHVAWVLRTDAAFEEAAAANASRRALALAKRAGRASMPAAGGVRRRFRLPLPAHSTPAAAIAWKNIVALGRTLAVRTVIAIVIVVVVVLVFLNQLLPETDKLSVIAGRLALAFALMLLFVGPLWVRNDLRLDMLELELLRSFPVRGATLVRAELSSALVTLAALQVPMLLAAYALNPVHNRIGQSWSDQSALLLTSLILLPSVSALGVLVQNAGVLLFPGWVRLGLSRPGGIEAIGQGIVTMFGSTLVLTVGLALPLVLGAPVAIVAVARVGLWGLVPGTAVGAAIVAGEVWLVTAWLGRVFERTDELPEEAVAPGAA
ncbi:MAG TPA: putative ABC exporter domain-containing protein [Gemmatimonadaceae bacterium]|nr:putative ABC exporter domain-containing protein [Gemmatimonadaceae bacterium]